MLTAALGKGRPLNLHLNLLGDVTVKEVNTIWGSHGDAPQGKNT